MKFLVDLNRALASGALAALLVVAPGVSAAGGIEGAWDKFHNDHVSGGGSVPAGAGISNPWHSFHARHLGGQEAAAPSDAASSLQNPWDRFHQSHIGSAGSQG
ncbi:MAG TPA: hypothetical protein VFP70_00265 [Burkholderiales bacterium]|nr:hypothetical protein [Burkholderiales bacterium]